MNRLAILVACPSKADAIAGCLLSGNQGTILFGLLGKHGVGREQCKVFAILDQPAPRNDAAGMEAWFDAADAVTLQGSISRLRDSLLGYAPTMVLALGVPLRLLKEAPDDKMPPSISDWRGSLFETRFIDAGGTLKPVKCLATYHPTWLTRDWSLQAYVKVDAQRCARELAAGPELSLPERTVHICDRLDHALLWIGHYREAGLAGNVISIDSEGGVSSLTMLGFSSRVDLAHVIPFIDAEGNSIWTEDEEVAIWEAAKELLEDPAVPKVMQNYQSDAFILAWSYGIVLKGLRHDVMLMAWEVQPELEKGLASVASIYTREPFWKSKHNYTHRLAHVCGMDCMLTLECCGVLERMLRDGPLQHYKLNLRHLPIVLYEMLEGLPFDRKQARADLKKLEQRIYETQYEIDKAAFDGERHSDGAEGNPANDAGGFSGPCRLPDKSPDRILALATEAFAQARRIEKIEQVEQRWQPMRWNGKKWVKTGKLMLVQNLPPDEPEMAWLKPVPREMAWLKPVPRAVQVSRQAAITSWNDLEKWCKESCMDACKQARKLAVSDHTPATLGELSILLGTAINTSATNQGGDCQRLLHDIWGLPKKFKKVRAEDDGNAGDPKVTTDKSALLSLYALTQQPSWAGWKRHGKLRGDELSAWLEESGRRLLLVLRMRSLEKERSYLDVETDSDGQLRYGLNLVKAATGRFAAYGSPTGKSRLNPQTVGKKHRHLYHV